MNKEYTHVIDQAILDLELYGKDNKKELTLWHILHRVLRTNIPETFFLKLDSLGLLETHFPEIANLKGIIQPEKYHPETIDDLQKRVDFDIDRTTGIIDHDVFIHTLLVLKEAVDKGFDSIVRLSCLCHDLGKTLSPKETLPKHHGHEEAGVPLVKKFLVSLKVPEEYHNVALITCREHLNIHKFWELNPKTVLKIFNRSYAYVHPGDFMNVIQSSICDANGRGETIPKVSYKKVDDIMSLIHNTMNIAYEVDDKYPDISKEKFEQLVNQRRLTKLKELIKKHKECI